jgi:GntR family transcriptional regulator/MocR family aminotransferase
MTVTVAYERLGSEGFVTSRTGAGTFVGGDVRSPAQKTRRGEGALRPRDVWSTIALPSAFDRPARYDFRTGLPDASLFPHRSWRRLMTSALRSSAAKAGVYEHPTGQKDLRAAIARHVAISRGVEASADDVIITNGTQQALDMVARVLLAPGDRIAVEDPGYDPPRRLFRSLGLRVTGVAVDRNGLVVDELPDKVRVFYVTPSHQYPLGTAMTLQQRHALLDWASRNDAAIIEDDYDSEFRFGGRPLEPLQTLDTAGRVIYVGSFSKTMLPTLRLGFLVAPRSLREALHKAKFVTDWHTATVVQVALARFIDDGTFARHTRKVNGVYRERHAVVTDAIARNFVDHLELIPSETGLHVAALARNASVEQMATIAARAADLGVAVQILSTFALGRSALAGLVLGYGAIATAQIREGLRILKRCFEREESRR